MKGEIKVWGIIALFLFGAACATAASYLNGRGGGAGGGF